MKKLFLIAAVMAWGMNAFADDTPTTNSGRYTEEVHYNDPKGYSVQTNTFWNNWFVSVGGGAQVYFGDHDKQMKFFDRLAPNLDIAVGKWFTPGIGVRLMYSGLSAKGATQSWGSEGIHDTGKPVDGKYTHAYGFLNESEFDFYNVHADVMFNMSNLLFGYNENRIWNCTPYVGLGWMLTWESPRAREVSANIGLLNTFRLSKCLDLNLDIRGTSVNDRFDGEVDGRKEEGLLSASLGLTYKFAKRGWERSKTIIRYDNQAINDMRAKLDAMTKENEKLKKALAEGKSTKEVETIVKNIAAANLVTFKINKSTLSNEARVNLGFLAEIIKSSDPNIVYTVTGYADKGTGNPEINQRLSEQRAKAVYDCLVDEFGVPSKQLRIDYKGGVENMFYNDPRLSRAVITRGE